MRRTKCLFISEKDVLAFFSIGLENSEFCQLPVFKQLPPQTDLVTVHCDYARQGFVFILSNPLWPEIPEGQESPFLGQTPKVTWVKSPRALEAEKDILRHKAKELADHFWTKQPPGSYENLKVYIERVLLNG